MTTINTGEMSKDGFNKKIDRQLLKKLGLAPSATISAIEFCRLVKKKISKDDILEIWKEKPDEETKRRIELLFLGIEKYLEKF